MVSSFPTLLWFPNALRSSVRCPATVYDTTAPGSVVESASCVSISAPLAGLLQCSVLRAVQSQLAPLALGLLSCRVLSRPVASCRALSHSAQWSCALSSIYRHRKITKNKNIQKKVQGRVWGTIMRPNDPRTVPVSIITCHSRPQDTIFGPHVEIQSTSSVI